MPTAVPPGSEEATSQVAAAETEREVEIGRRCPEDEVELDADLQERHFRLQTLQAIATCAAHPEEFRKNARKKLGELLGFPC